MSFNVFLVVLLSLLSLPLFAAEKKPNVLFILCDDLGYGDLGVLYQNARAKDGKPAHGTPNIDQMAVDGLILRQHYCAAPVCAPSRGSLMTGQSQGHCAIRDNEFDKPIPPGVMTLGEMLKQAGYHTIAIGKWGLGGHKDSDFPSHPLKRGFDEFFGFMLHRDGHVYYHDKEHPLWENSTDVGAKYENVYSTDLFTARAKKYITDHEAQHPDQPFFMYLAYTAVHAELNVPGEPYPKGAGKSGGLQWPLAPTPKTRDTYIYPDYAEQKSWNEPMKRYATMARRMDDCVGDIRQVLKDLKIDQDTLIIFSSDNGPANEGGGDPRFFSSWGPFDGFKRDVWEGGEREPTLAVWPGQIKPGRISDLPSAQYDWMPTLADVAQLPIPAQTDGVSLLPTLLDTGKQVPHPYIYVEYLHKGGSAASKDVFARKGVTGRGQQQIVRIGDYVGVRVQIKEPSDPLRLYNVMKDPHEDHNLASDPSHADLLKQMTDLLVTARRPDAEAKRPYDDVPMPAVKVEHLVKGELKIETFDGDWPWTPDFTTLKPSDVGGIKGILWPPKDKNTPFGLRFTGYLSVPKDGEYTFKGVSDQGLHLWLHDARIIDCDHCNGEITAKVRLAAGFHPLRIAYNHRKGDPMLVIRYSGPDLKEQDLSEPAFARDPDAKIK